MPATEVYFYQDERRRAPVVEWLEELRGSDRRAYAKCVVRLRRLAEAGHELRRPEADFVREGLYELRARQGRSITVSCISFMAAMWPSWSMC